MVIPGLDRIGGAERQTMLLALGLLNRGWQVSVVALTGSGGPAAANLIAAGAAFHTLEMRKGLADPRGWLRFRRWLKQHAPDVVHAHLPHAAWLARWSRLATPIRVVVDTLHSSSTGSRGRQLGYRYSNWLPDRVTAVSQAVAASHLADRMVSKQRLFLLPNGVDVDAWKPNPAARRALRRELGIKDEFLWFAAGRLDPVKDYSTLFWAFAQMPSTDMLVIAGSGPLLEELGNLATRLGIGPRVRFLGFQPDLLRWMQAADGYALSSRWEGLPMGLMEAAACALPAVATDVPGTREVVADGQTGFLAKPGSALAFENAMTSLKQTPQKERKAIGQRARSNVIERFSLQAVLDRWEGLYQDLLARNPRRRRWGRAP